MPHLFQRVLHVAVSPFAGAHDTQGALQPQKTCEITSVGVRCRSERLSTLRELMLLRTFNAACCGSTCHRMITNFLTAPTRRQNPESSARTLAGAPWLASDAHYSTRAPCPWRPLAEVGHARVPACRATPSMSCRCFWRSSMLPTVGVAAAWQPQTLKGLWRGWRPS